MSTAKQPSKYDAEILELVMQYREENFGKPFEISFVAVWAMKENLWRGPQKHSLYKLLKKDIARVAKAARHVDPQRRRVRTLHAAKVACALASGKVVQKVLWDHLNTMSLDHAQTSFSQRLEQIGNASVSLNRDKNSFIDNNPNAIDGAIQLSFNFEMTVEQAEEQQVQELPLPDLSPIPDATAPSPLSSPLP